jgi:methylated-DNA-[protein]-cysteine S-methyltransferase
MGHATLQTPFGQVSLFATDEALVRLDWVLASAANSADPLIRRAIAALRAYFDDGEPLPADLPLAPAGTPFQQRVWQRLRAIPHGQTASYAALAAELGTGPRALAGACAANPLPILVPCHRVVGSGGHLGGYSGGGGVATKAALLQHEGIGPAAAHRLMLPVTTVLSA